MVTKLGKCDKTTFLTYEKKDLTYVCDPLLTSISTSVSFVLTPRGNA